MKKFIYLFLSASFVSLSANAKEIQCRVSDAFGKPQGALLLDYNEPNKSLTLIKTEGDNAIFGGQYSWIGEAVGRPAKNLSTNPNVISVNYPGEYNWKFVIDRQNGSIKINQSRAQMFWEGRCSLVDRSNKF